MIYEDYIKVLNIDLTEHKIRIDKRKDLVKYIGGVGVASKLLEENMMPELSPLDESQPIVLAIGPFNGIYPVMTKTVAMFISPLTGEMGESYAGGRLGLSMFNAKFDAIVIKGKSQKPCYITINPNDVSFKDARVMWGKTKDYSTTIIRTRESKDSGKRSIINIGTAGENLVPTACVTVDKYRHFGRLGLGAVFGSKNLKAISVIGGKDTPIKDFANYFKTYKNLMSKCKDTDLMAKYHDAGTPINIVPLNEIGGLPSYNLKLAKINNADSISGESFCNNYLIRKIACAGCPVGCIHIAQFRRKFADDGYEYESISVGYDYELIFSLGTFLGIDNPQHILELIDSVEEHGLDAMSTGVCLGYATEALEQGIITTEETLVNLKFGNYEQYKVAIKHMAFKTNDFYEALGKGVRHASKIYGGEDFAMQIAGNEMSGYHTGYGALVGATVGARHSHLCNGGYSVDQANKDISEDELVDKIYKEEVQRCLVNSLTICLFARRVYSRETILECFKSIGCNYTSEQLDEVAENIYKTKLRIKKSLGFDIDNVKLPKRFFETPSANGILNEETTKRMIKKYSDKIKLIDLESTL